MDTEGYVVLRSVLCSQTLELLKIQTKMVENIECFKINENPKKDEINQIIKDKSLSIPLIRKYNIKFGLQSGNGYVILNSLYNIFNISTLYLYDYYEDTYFVFEDFWCNTNN